jgi:hypothetical protein
VQSDNEVEVEEIARLTDEGRVGETSEPKSNRRSLLAVKSRSSAGESAGRGETERVVRYDEPLWSGGRDLMDPGT